MNLVFYDVVINIVRNFLFVNSKLEKGRRVRKVFRMLQKLVLN